MNSIWEKKKLNYPSLNKDIDRDIVIIGGGIAGLLTAYQLTEAGKQVTLIEANEILINNVTSRTTAKISSLQGILYQDLINKYGLEFAVDYFESQEKSITMYEELIEKYKIECEFEKYKAYIFSRNKQNKIKEEYQALKKIGANPSLHNYLDDLPLKIEQAVSIDDQGQFDPLLFLYGLPRNYEIYENTKVIRITDEAVFTENGNKIKANKIIIATHFPIKNFWGMFLFKMYQSTSYVVACNTDQKINGMYLEDTQDGLSFRTHKDYILVGACDHRTGRAKDDNYFAQLKLTFKSLFSGDCLDSYEWVNEDCMTFDSIPYVGNFSKANPNIYVITGFNKWGMSNSMISSIVIKDLILGIENKYAYLFSPQRKRISKHIDTFLVNTAVNVKGLLTQAIGLPLRTEKSLKNNEGGVVFYKGKKRAVYKDENGKIYDINPKCGHVHCGLKFNPNTITWDCPCHGSRYDIYGNILNGPASKTFD